MAGYGGIGGLPQTRDLFTAPGSLLGYDPYFQDVQRFQKGGSPSGPLGTMGMGTTDIGRAQLQQLQTPQYDKYGNEVVGMFEGMLETDYATALDRGPRPGVGMAPTFTDYATALDRDTIPSVTYASLQDPDPYGAERTAGQRGRSLFGYAPWDDPRNLALGVAGTLMGAPLGVPALISGGIGAYQTLGEADKMRAGALPPGTAEPLGFWDSLSAIFSDYENAFTDEDMETLSAYGLGGDLGVEAGGYNIADAPGTWADAPSGGPRVNTPLGIAQSNWAQMRAKELAQAARYGESWTDPNPPPAWLGRPRPPDPITVETLPPPDPITVETLPEIYVSDDSATGGGGESYGFGSMDTSDYGLGY